MENILQFLDDFAKNIVFQGVHMVYNAQVSGEVIAFGVKVGYRNEGKNFDISLFVLNLMHF